MQKPAMDKTPVMSRSRLSCRRNNIAGTSTGNEPNEDTNTFPSASFLDTRMLTDFENDESPVRIACTQEGCENVDVVWDWNSPQVRKPKRSQKRLILQSPKNPLKKNLSNNQIQDFDTIKEELRSLREQIALPDNEDSLVLSPLEEAEYKDISSVLNKSSTTSVLEDNNCLAHEDDLFNDSVDEQLVLFSQRIESDLNTLGHTNQLSANNTNRRELDYAIVQKSNKKQMCDLSIVKNSNRHVHSAKLDVGGIAKTDSDLFDIMLQEIKVDRIKEATEVIGKRKINQDTTNNNHCFPKTLSQDHCTTSKQMDLWNVKFPRTHSFESTLNNSKEKIPQSKLDEIERKRKEALAKLQSKKKQEFNDSLMKCTPEEIERKRLQALAKREAKRQQDIIERNRQEALKRLELKRKKNGNIINNPIAKRS